MGISIKLDEKNQLVIVSTGRVWTKKEIMEMVIDPDCPTDTYDGVNLLPQAVELLEQMLSEIADKKEIIEIAINAKNNEPMIWGRTKNGIYPTKDFMILIENTLGIVRSDIFKETLLSLIPVIKSSLEVGTMTL